MTHLEGDHLDIHGYSDSKIDKSIILLLRATGFSMLVAPLWILARTPDIDRKLAVITGFLLIFMILVSILTVSKSLELMAATAA